MKIPKILQAAGAKVAEKIGDLIIQQWHFFFQDEHGQPDQIKRELNEIQCLLEDADSKKWSSEMVKEWMNQVREIAYRAEDAIDNFDIGKERRKRKRLPLPFYDMWARRDFGHELNEIKKNLDDLYQRILNYGFGNLNDYGKEGSSSGGSLQERRQTSPLLEDSEPVGFKTETFVEWLTESHLRMLSIVGIAGLGKTTLARKVYNNEDIRRHFHCFAWVYVSKKYKHRDILLGILTSENILQDIWTDATEMDGFGTKENLIKSLEEMDVVHLKEKLSQHLKKKRCLVVLDDVWDSTAWDFLVSVFQNTNFGSRILLTTRNKAVVSWAQNIYYELKCLSEEESWELFCMRTFPEQGMQCPQNLKQIGKEIVAKCYGLPLAIVVVGGLLSRKEKNEHEWEKMLRHVSTQFVEINQQMKETLALSYDDLPSHLKPCFLHFGSLPEDEVKAEKLVRLWIAEGYVKPLSHVTMEDVAIDYLDELVVRSLVQVTKRSDTGWIRTCRMHNLLRDFCLSKANESMFLHVDGNSPPPPKVRRLAVHHRIHGHYSFDALTANLHSLSYNIPDGDTLRNKLFCSRFKFLRVLDLRGVLLRELPDELSELNLLKYLGCRRTEIEYLPSSIERLSNLQTLDVTSSKIVKIPNAIWKMQQLRHFHVKGRTTEFDNPLLELDFSHNLRTLTHVEAGKWVNDYLGKQTCLRKLGIWGGNLSEYKRGLFEAIPRLEKLRYLKLGEWDDCFIPTLPPLTDHPNLRNLFLHGKLEKQPKSHEFPPNLTKLTLRMTKLEADPMPTLEKLNKLKTLKLLDEAYSGNEMVCSAQGFPLLGSLHVVYLNNLEDWTVAQGAMPKLQYLDVKYCYNLRAVPERLLHLAALT